MCLRILEGGGLNTYYVYYFILFYFYFIISSKRSRNTGSTKVQCKIGYGTHKLGPKTHEHCVGA